MFNEKMDIQKLAYFTEGNTFTGSRTKDWAQKRLLRYLIRPNREEGKLLCWAWTEDLCFEKAREKQAGEFPLTEEGLSQAELWLRGLYETL